MKNNAKNSISYIDINSLKFDSENPRLPVKRRNASEKSIIEWMLLDAGLLELISSIGQNGFFHGEPLLVEKVSRERTNMSSLRGTGGWPPASY